MVSSVAVVVVCLVFLSRLMYCSMSALTLWGRTEVLASLSFHTDWRMIAVVRVMGRLVSGPTSPYSSLSAAPGCRPGIDCCRHCTSCCPTPLFLLQYRSSCSRVPSSEHPGILHSGERMVPILNSFDWVQSRFNIILHRKLASSGGTPGCLQAAQDRDQSVAGLASSALQGMTCLWSFSAVGSMVMNSSVRNLVQSFSAIFTTLR